MWIYLVELGSEGDIVEPTIADEDCVIIGGSHDAIGQFSSLVVMGGDIYR